MISEFLLEKFNEGRAPSTLAGYRTAIAKTLKPRTGIDLGEDKSLSDLLHNFEIERPVSRNQASSWDLSLVLNHLASSPFEPLEKAPLKLLTYKTVFLIALASGRRRGEIHALAHDKVRWKGNSEVRLGVLPSFVAKTQLAASPPLSFTIPALDTSLGQSLEADVKLCPLRALRLYLERTAQLRGDRRLMFISFQKTFKRDI